MRDFIKAEIENSPIIITAKEVTKTIINVSVQYEPNENDLVHNGVKTFNPLKSRMGNQNSRSMGMFLMHEQLAAMGVDYELSIIKKEPPLAQFSMNFAKGD